MKINDDHLYHGAALTQIAEHPSFTAINAFKTGDSISRSIFRVNDDIGIYLKYASKPHGRYREYVFTFHTEHLDELRRADEQCARVFVALVCVKDRHVCCLKYSDLLSKIGQRRKSKGADEEQYSILAVLPKNKQFRIYVNAPGKKKTKLSPELLVRRNAFPNELFE